MNLFQQLAAFLQRLFGVQAPSQDGGASVPSSTVIYPDKPQPGSLVLDAPAHYPDPLQLLSFNLYGPDVSGTPHYPTSAVSGSPAGASWADRVAAFLNSLGPAFSFTPATPLPAIGTGHATLQDSGLGKTSPYTAPPTSIGDVFSPPPPPPPAPPVIGSTGGNVGGVTSTGGAVQTTQSPLVIRQPSGKLLGSF